MNPFLLPFLTFPCSDNHWSFISFSASAFSIQAVVIMEWLKLAKQKLFEYSESRWSIVSPDRRMKNCNWPDKDKQELSFVRIWLWDMADQLIQLLLYIPSTIRKLGRNNWSPQITFCLTDQSLRLNRWKSQEEIIHEQKSLPTHPFFHSAVEFISFRWIIKVNLAQYTHDKNRIRMMCLLPRAYC